MRSAVNIVLRGGPADGHKVAIPDYAPEYRVVLAPRREDLLSLSIREGVYRRSSPIRSRHVMGEPLPYVYAGEETR